jgi:hypothetical protein
VAKRGMGGYMRDVWLLRGRVAKLVARLHVMARSLGSNPDFPQNS